MECYRTDLRAAVRRARGGELDAFGFVVGRFREMTVGYAYSILKDYHLAEDVSQDAFILAFERLDQLAEPESFPGWLRRIVFTCCNRVRRHPEADTVSLDVVAEPMSVTPRPDAGLEREERNVQLREALARLPDAERAATTLYYLSGCAQSDIAAFLEVPASTIKSRIFKARRRLKGIIERSFEDLVPTTATGQHERGEIMTFRQMFPELHVSDVERAASFFTEAMDFKRGFEHEADGLLDFAVMKNGEHQLHLHHMLPDEEADQPKRMRLFFNMEGIDNFHAGLREKGFEATDLEDQPYGARNFMLLGPDEYEIWFQQWTH